MRALILACGLLAFSSLSFGVPAKRVLIPTLLKDFKVCGDYADLAAKRLEASLKIPTMAKCEKYTESDGTETILFAFSFDKNPPVYLSSTKTTATVYTEKVPVAQTVQAYEYVSGQLVTVTKTVTIHQEVPVTATYGDQASCDKAVGRLIDSASPTFKNAECVDGECLTYAGYCTGTAPAFKFNVHRLHLYRGKDERVIAGAAEGESYAGAAQYEVMPTAFFNSTVCDSNMKWSLPQMEKLLGMKVDGRCLKATQFNGFELYPILYELEKAGPRLQFETVKVNPVKKIPRTKTESVVEYAYEGDTNVVKKSTVTKTIPYVESVPVTYGDPLVCDQDARNALLAKTLPELTAKCNGKNCAPVVAYCDYTPETALYHYLFHVVRN